MKDTYISTTEAAKRLGVKESAIRAMARRGELDGIRVTRFIRVTEESLERFVEGARIGPRAS